MGVLQTGEQHVVARVKSALESTANPAAVPLAQRMKRVSVLVAIGYAIWVAYNLHVAIDQVGDGGVGAHLALLFTGFPASLLSLPFHHGSLLAVVGAGALGLAQWILFCEFILRSRARRRGV